MARHARAASAVAQRAERARGRRRADPARHRGPRRPPHPRAVRRPAAAGVHRPRAARRPDLLLMDEPTSGVDVDTRHDILHLLDDLHDVGLAIVLTTHDLNGIAAHLPHVVCLNTEVIGEGTPREVAHRRHPRADLRRAHGDPRARRACRSCSTTSTTGTSCHRDADRELRWTSCCAPSSSSSSATASSSPRSPAPCAASSACSSCSRG